MDLLLAHSSSTPPGYREPTRNDCCLMHPATMLDLHVPALGLVSIEHAHLHDGAEAFIQCLPLESIPRGAIYLPRWMLLGMDADKVQAVRVQGIDVERPLDVADKVVVVSYPFEGKKPRLDHWIKPTHANNADLIRRGRKGRQWTENLIKLAIDGQAVSIGSVLAAKIKGQGHRFRVVDIVFKRSSESNVGVVVHDTILEIGQETASKSTQPSSHCGMDGLVQEICSFINDSFSRMDAYTLLNIPNKKAAIITGVAGSGKKALIRMCCQRVGLRMFPLSLPRALSDKDIMESDQADGLSYIRTVFDMALQSSPSAVVLQDLDIIAKERRVDSKLQSSTVSILCKEMERARRGKEVFVFAVSRDRSKLPEVFMKQDVFQHEFQVPVPVRAQRQEIIEAIMSSSDVITEKEPTFKSMASKVAPMSAGYVAKDLRNVYRSAVLHSLRKDSVSSEVQESLEPLTDLMSKTTLADKAVQLDQGQKHRRSLSHHASVAVTWRDFAYALDISKPSQQVEFESLARSREWNDFGGYSSVKRRVYQGVHWPLTNPDTFRRMGVRPPMGLLLYGPSGCGKTMLVHSLASKSNMNFIPIKGPEIFSKYLGETEATLRRLFAMARQIAPCILFFDEMDSIGAKRGWGGDGESQGSSGVNERVLSTLLNEMDGVEERMGVFVIGCTNQPRAMDDALLRPGRLDQLVYIGYPTLQDRKEIIETIGRRIPLPQEDPTTRDVLASKTVGFSPADLDTLFREAAILSLRRDIASQQVHMDDIELVLKRMAPSVHDRIDKSIPQGDSDVVIPDLYRQFQQER